MPSTVQQEIIVWCKILDISHEANFSVQNIYWQISDSYTWHSEIVSETERCCIDLYNLWVSFQIVKPPQHL